MPDDVRSLYRRWRSRTFHELIGQDHVSRTLLNALESGRVAHAYLFAGPRGSGKTSTARILAKAVNCLTTGGRGEPCNTCEMCVAINEGRALDLIEIDAASNRGIDEIRDLRDKVHFAPTQARFKVYILDEAHMLTNEAFNALLKTLEEPPAHVIFALVTTEAHRIPPTIVSRCQRFDFHRAAHKDIVAKLTRICQEENIKAEPAALAAIARTATGSYRDAESLLDQLSSFTGEEGITLRYVQQVLGLAPLDAVDRLVGHMARRETAEGLRLLNTIVENGADLRQFNRELIDYLRDLILVKTGNEALIDAAPDTLAAMTNQARHLSVADLLRFLKLFSEPELSSGLRFSAQPQLPIEMAFLQACGLGAETATGSASGVATSAQGVGAPASGTVAAVTPSVTRTAATPPPAPSAPPARSAASPSARPAGAATSPARPTAGASPATRPPTYGAALSADRAAPTTSAAPRPPAAPAPARPYSSSAVTVTAPPGTPLADIQEKWPAFLEKVKASSRSVEAFLKACRPLEADDQTVVLGFFYKFHMDSVDNAKNRGIVEAALSAILGRPTHLRCTLTAKEGPASAAAAAGAKSASLGDDNVVKSAKELFGGTVLAVEENPEG